MENRGKKTIKTKPKKKRNLGFIKYIISLFVLFVLAIVFFLGGYSYIMKKSYTAYESAIKKDVDDLNKINSDISTLIKGQAIDTTKVKAQLPAKITALRKIEDDANKLVPTDKYRNSHLSLIQGITANINIYDQLISILNNPDGSDLTASVTNLKQNKNDCLKNYAQVAIADIKITLPSNTQTFVDYSISYGDQLAKLKANQDIITSENNDFSNGINDIFQKFLNLKTDFKAQVLNVRSGTGSYDDLINQIADNKDKLNDLKVALTKLSVPQKTNSGDPMTVLNSLKKSLDDYDSYLDAFTYAAATEKAQAAMSSLDIDAANKLYTDADLKMAALDKDYNDFVSTFNNYKNANQ